MASIWQKIFGGGGGSATPTVGTNPYAGNPYTTGGVQPMNIGGFKPAPADFKWGGGSSSSPSFGGSFGGGFGNMAGMSGLGNVGAFNPYDALAKRGMGASRYNPDGEPETGGAPKPPRGRLGKIKELLTGESGAAIGGLAQGAGTVIGAYMNRKSQGEMTKLERQKFEEELRRQALMEQQQKALRDLLMPTIQQLRPR